MRLVFLGTGGGRHVMFSQTRKTGGVLFDFGSVRFIMDPGPGSLVNAVSAKLKPEKWNGVVLSHLHIDHVTDANVYLDGIESPFIVAEQHCLLSRQKTKAGLKYYPCITPYHQNQSEVRAMKDGDRTAVNGVEFEAVKADHYDPAIGYRIKYKNVDVGYTGDGSYYRGMESRYDGCKVLIVHPVIPKGQESRPHWHMSVDGVISLVKGMQEKLSLIVLTHLGFWLMRSNLWKQEKIIKDATGVKTIHAEDFMALDLNTLAVSRV